MKRLIILFTIGITIGACSQTQSPSYILVDAKRFQQEIKKEGVQLLDVRTPQEFKEGVIKGAINIDYKSPTFEKDIESLDKSKTVYVYCLGGGRSANASAILVQNGYDVVELEGGVMNWRNNDLPMVGVENNGDEITNYDTLINQEGIVVIDFYADWCMPCKKMKPSLDKLDQLEGVTVIRINADKNPVLAKNEGVSGLPALRYYKDGVLKQQGIGFVSEEDLFKIVKVL